MWPFSKKEKRASLENPQVSISDPNVVHLVFGGDTTDSGESVSPDTALSVPAVWSAVNFISGTIASLPLKVYRDTQESRIVDRNTPWFKRLHDAPNESWTSYRWRKYSMLRVLLQGRSLTFIDRSSLTLWPLPPSKVTIRREGGRLKYEYREKDDNRVPDAIYDEAEIIDVPFMMDEDPVDTISPVSRLKDVIGLSLALQKYAARHFRNGGMPPAVLQGPAMSPGAAQRASNDVKESIATAMREGRVPALPEGYEMKTLGTNPEQSQMEASRRFQIEEIARVYDLPPVFLQDLTHGTYSNTEQQDLHFVKHTLTHWLRCWEQEINLKLFRGRAQSGRFAEFSVDGLLRGDFKARMEGLAQGVQNSLITPNEGRAMDNREPKEGGDELIIQQNMSQLDLLGSADAGADNADPAK